MSEDFASALAQLRAMALAYPEAYEEQPWGDLAAKVRKKMFAMYGASAKGLHFTVKLPHSAAEALTVPEVSPTGYGLGKHGWVSARFTDPAQIDVPTLYGWMEESYRTVAPKRLSKGLPLGGPLPGERPVIPELAEHAPVVVVVSDDALRAERCVVGLAQHGVRGERATTADLDALADVHASAIVVDLGRSQALALEVAGQLALLHFDCALVLAGIRDSRADSGARSALPGAIAWLREPPGDPLVVEALVELTRS